MNETEPIKMPSFGPALHMRVNLTVKQTNSVILRSPPKADDEESEAAYSEKPPILRSFSPLRGLQDDIYFG